MPTTIEVVRMVDPDRAMLMLVLVERADVDIQIWALGAVFPKSERVLTIPRPMEPVIVTLAAPVEGELGAFGIQLVTAS